MAKTAENSTSTPQFTFKAVSRDNRPKRVGRGGKGNDPEIGRAMLRDILAGNDISDGIVYEAATFTKSTTDENGKPIEETKSYTADEMARRVCVKAQRYLNEALTENPQKNEKGENLVAGSVIRDGTWTMFLTPERAKRTKSNSKTPAANS